MRGPAGSFPGSRRAERFAAISGLALAAFAALLACAPAARAAATEHDPLAAFRALDPATVERVLALDPAHVTPADVRDVLARVPAPRIFLLQGSVAFVSMSPFAEFLVAMGYPEERLRNAPDGGFSRSSFTDSAQLAGEVAWRYERDAVMPMLIGHSQGGMLAIRVLYELIGEFDAAIPVRDPSAGEALARTTLRDPLTGQARPVVGLKVPYVAALATGKTMRVLLGQWSMLSRLRRIPDSVDEFSGYWIPGDPLAGGLWDEERYRATGTARVRNVTLPASYSHIGLPLTAHLAANPVTRAWIDAYDPAAPQPAPDGDSVDTSNLTHAADIWYSVKRHWCDQAQRALRAVRPAS